MEWAAKAAADAFGLEGTLDPLPGDRDLNLLLTTESEDRWVVKVTSPDEADATLDFECEVMSWLAEGHAVPVPAHRRTSDGEVVAVVPHGERSWRVRVLEYLPGSTLAAVRPRGFDLLEELGRRVGALDVALAGFSGNPPDRPDFQWALARAGTVIEAGLDAVPEAKRHLLEAALDRFRDAEPVFGALPEQIIHGDVNDHNVLVSSPGGGSRRVTGILDFGDFHMAPAVFDLAIAMAYGALESRDPIQAAAQIAAGYRVSRPLSEEELGVLHPLMVARLGASVAISATRRADGGDVSDYHLVSEEPAWAALEAMAGIHPRLARGILRDACGLPACPRAAALVAWLPEQELQPVMDIDPESTTVLDMSVGSPILTGRDTDDTEAFTARTWRAMRECDAAIGIGRYDEPRGFYLTEAFAGREGEPPERRTIHMGIDVFDDPGAEVRAFMPSVVKSVHDNAGRLDYGPTVILEHEGPEGPFWTLYGHLERTSVEGLEVGQRLEAGDAFARVGPHPENGDWPPHLHLQIVTDLLGWEADFPGVALPRERGVWKSFCPDPNLILRLPLETTYRDPSRLRDRRDRVMGRSLSVSYDHPIHVVRGVGAYLYDQVGREYLDCVNNVAHVGHEHPHVVEAGQRQMAVLNTNTRYLHEAVLEYAESLQALFPEPLSVCFFTNSGSEANELALRMARAHTGGRGIVAVEGGYHGNTQGTVDVSHYKFAGPGGEGPPSWVRAIPMPDGYRGRHRRSDPEHASKYAAHVAEALASLRVNGQTPAAFLCESLLSCAGQVVLPEGFLEEALWHIRGAGAVFIADEVQVGFGRVGSHMWGFETSGVVPDIVTLGKPMGNGHPIGAVVTTPDIAESFANGMEFFSTFGGNPVSACIGQAVLDVIEGEELQAHALAVGSRLAEGLEGLMERHPVIGEVRGRGLFLGIELVADRDWKRPAPSATDYAVQRMRARNILLSTDGPDHNVIKIKPPLVFSADDADRVVEELDAVLGEDFIQKTVDA
jgi:4-aminobutyrate aminotransferase-like enzyme/Ser/Thr protein kinase RdoA (MazF antagonist)